MATTELDADSSALAHDPDLSEQQLASLLLPSNSDVESWSEHERVDVIESYIQELSTGNNLANGEQNNILPEEIPVRRRRIPHLSGRFIAAIVCGTVGLCFIVVLLILGSGSEENRLALRR